MTGPTLQCPPHATWPAPIRWLASPAAALCLVALAMLASRLDHGDVRVDGPIYAWASRHMVISGDWLNLYFDHGQTPYFNKPPLQFWITAGLIRLLGPTTLAAKLPSVLFGLGCLWLTWRLARRRFDDATAATAGLVLVTSYTFFRNVSAARLDAGVTFFFLLVLETGLQILEQPAPRLRNWVRLGLAFGLGFMVKSGAVFLALPILIATAAWDRHLRRLMDWRWLVTLAIAAAIILPWYIHQHLTWGPEFLAKHFGREQLGRFVSDTFGSTPWYFWGQQLLSFYWPWLPLAAWGVWRACRTPAGSRGTVDRLFLAWLAVAFLILHGIPRKHDRYLLFVLPVLAVFAAEALMAWPRVARFWRDRFLPNAGWSALLIFIALQISPVQLSRTQLPELQATAALIQSVVPTPDGARRPVVFTVGEINLQHACAIRYYTGAWVVPLGRPGGPEVQPGDFLVRPRRGSADTPATLPPHRLLVSGRLLDFYWVLSGP